MVFAEAFRRLCFPAFYVVVLKYLSEECIPLHSTLCLSTQDVFFLRLVMEGYCNCLRDAEHAFVRPRSEWNSYSFHTSVRSACLHARVRNWIQAEIYVLRGTIATPHRIPRVWNQHNLQECVKKPGELLGLGEQCHLATPDRTPPAENHHELHKIMKNPGEI